MPDPPGCFAWLPGKPPSPQPSPQGEREFRSQPLRRRPFSHPHPPADADTRSCKLAKASLPGEGQDEGVFHPSVRPDCLSSEISEIEAMAHDFAELPDNADRIAQDVAIPRG